MKIIGGTLGTSGSALVAKRHLFVKAQGRERQYSPAQIESMEAEKATRREFSAVSFLLGAVILGGFGFFFFNIIGLVGGAILAALGSKRKTTDHLANLEFSDGERVTLSCTPRGIKRLLSLRS